MKILPQIIENFIYSNFSEAKPTSSGELHFNSPFVKDGKNRLYVNPNKGSFFDQKQQIGGTFIQFVSEYLGVSEKDAYIILIKEYSLREHSNITQKEIINQYSEIKLPPGTIFFNESNPKSRTCKIAKHYLQERQIPIDDLAYVYDPNGDFKETFHERIIIPFYENNELVYFIARSFTNSTLRYKNPKNIDAGDFVFNIDKLTEDIFIFEGVFDALSLHLPQVGTAMLSNKLKDNQIIKMLDLAPKNIIFVLENDKNKIAIETGIKNLKLNYLNFIKYKPINLKLNFYTYRPPLQFKDFNEYSHKENIHSIDLKDCEKYNPKQINIKSFF